MSKKTVMLFTGAPPASTVDADSCTINTFDSSLNNLLGPHDGNSQSQSQNHGVQQEPVSASDIAWRSIPLIRQPLHTGFSQLHQLEDLTVKLNNSDFFTTQGDTTTAEGIVSRDQDVVSQFCEQSLALHESFEESVNQSFVSTTTGTSFATTDSFVSDADADADPNADNSSLLSAHLSDLEDIPSARQIESLNPQVVTVNLIVGIISIAQPRTVTTRWGTTLSLVEILVGDETKCGFGITFWLSKNAMLENEVAKLRRQNVVLVRNVALHVFRNKVYGQSLPKGQTQVRLLWGRNGEGRYSTRSLSKNDESATHPQKEKARKAMDWVLRFVGPDPASTRRPGAKKSWDEPPDDSFTVN